MKSNLRLIATEYNDGGGTIEIVNNSNSYEWILFETEDTDEFRTQLDYLIALFGCDCDHKQM